jgi:hypothetical protein
MSQLTSPPTDLMIPGTDADTNPTTTPRAEVSTPGQLHFFVPIARPTGPVVRSHAEVSTPGQLYFFVPIAETASTALSSSRLAMSKCRRSTSGAGGRSSIMIGTLALTAS